MKITLDNIIFSLQKCGGISVVWQNIIEGLEKANNLNWECIEYHPGAMDNISRKLLKGNNLLIRSYRISKIIERYLNPIVEGNAPFIFHSSYYRTCSNRNAINVTTVHDFTYEYYRSGISKWIHCWQKHKAIRKSDMIVCISENTKKDLLHFLPDVNPAKVRIIYNGVSERFFHLDEAILDDMSNYVLYVGGRDKYKNFRFVVEALKNTDYKLAIVGSPLSKEEIAYLDVSIGINNYKSYVRISDEQLNELYNSVCCLVYPSEYEGFGIPVVEAQKAGCPVIAFNGSSIPEVIGDTPLLLNNIDVEEFRGKLNILKNKSIRSQVIENGYKNSDRFSWSKMSSEYISLYEEMAQHLKKDKKMY